VENAAAETSTHLQLAVATCLPAPRGNHAPHLHMLHAQDFGPYIEHHGFDLMKDCSNLDA
jgi:hypothetical protein